MKWLTFEIQREPGFRLNLIDLGLLACVAGITIGLRAWIPGSVLVWLPLYVAFSFFLFCNVFRIGNRLEVLWYVPFVAIVLGTFRRPELLWPVVLSVCEPLRILLIVARLRRGNYRGIFCRGTSEPQLADADPEPPSQPGERANAPESHPLND